MILQNVQDIAHLFRSRDDSPLSIELNASITELIAESVLPAQFLDRHTRFSLFQKPDNLLFRKPLLQVHSPLENGLY